MTQNPKTKLFIPILNLNVESSIKIGDTKIHPATFATSVAHLFQQQDAVKDIQTNLEKSAFVEVETERLNDKLIPKDRERVKDIVRESMSILFLMQKQIAGIYSIRNQIFGLANETPSSLNFIAAIEDDKQSYGFQREGNFAEWTFTTTSIQEIQRRQDFQFLSRIAGSVKRNDIEERIMNAIGLLYEGALEMKPQYRFTKAMTAFEVILLKKKDSKKFTLAKYCTMISHGLLHPKLKCRCPISISNNSLEYTQNVNTLGLPGICSAYNDFVTWYEIRSNISHQGNIEKVNDNITSFEWWAYQYFMIIIELVIQNGCKNLSELRNLIEQKYTHWRNSF